MKTICATLALAILVTGCATPLTYDQQRQQAKFNTVDELCLVTIIRPEYRAAAEDEIAERKATCDWQKVQLMMQARQMQSQQQAADARELSNTLYMLNSLQPRYTAPKPAYTTCNRVGNGVTCVTQ